MISKRFERNFRLWAASGQAALESSKVLVISASATSTSILKNLVLPGIGQFTIIDDKAVTPEDAGNNFFLNGHHSIGKSRAEEAVTCLRELNDGVEGISDTSNFEQRFNSDPSFLAAYTIVIAHNLHPTLLDKVAELLWTDPSLPTLIVVRSAGFLAEFFIQFHEHHGESGIQSYMRTFSSRFLSQLSSPTPKTCHHCGLTSRSPASCNMRYPWTLPRWIPRITVTSLMLLSLCVRWRSGNLRYVRDPVVQFTS